MSDRKNFSRLIRALIVLVLPGLVALLGWRSCAGGNGAPTDRRAEAKASDPSSRNGAPPQTPNPPVTTAKSDAPGDRLRAMTFAIDATGVRLQQAISAPGRVKAPPRSVAANRIEFEAYDANGTRVYAGSFDHPLHRVLEYEDPNSPGTLRSKAHEVAADVFQLRLPDSVAAERVDFFEVRANSPDPLRTPVGSVRLQGLPR